VISGTKSAPREILLDNSILPKKDPGFVRVSTPPRVITLSDHHFPSASDERSADEDDEGRYYNPPKTLEFADDTKKNNRNSRKGNQSSEIMISQRWAIATKHESLDS
jgi:mitochondrial fission factor